MFRWFEIMAKDNNYNPGDYVYLVYAMRFRLSSDRDQVFNIFKHVFSYDAYRQDDTKMFIRFNSTHIQIGRSIFRFSVQEILNNSDHLRILRENEYQLTNFHSKYLEAIIKCLDMNWLVLLVGKACSGKTMLMRMLANMCHRNLIEISVNSTTDTSDLVGCFTKAHIQSDVIRILKQLKRFQCLKLKNNINNIQGIQKIVAEIFEIEKYKTHIESIDIGVFNNCNIDAHFSSLIQFIRSHISVIEQEKNIEYNYLKAEILCEFKNLNKKFKTSGSQVKFEWVDSNLIQAIRNGDWVLIDNANFCNPSILDRLNPLMEPGGILNITEKGCLNNQLNIVKPHQNFRLFLCMNEAFGDISRAMRNRGIELYVDEIDLTSVDSNIILHNIFTKLQQDDEILKSNFLVEFLTELKKSLVPTIKFEEALNLCKLVRDYWIVNKSTFIESLLIAFNEIYPEYDKNAVSCIIDTTIKSLEQNKKIVNLVYSDVFKLTKFPIYRFFSDFPIYSSFYESLMANNTSSIVEINKQTAYLQIWLQNLPIKYKDLIEVYLFQDSLMAKNNVNELKNFFNHFFKTTIFDRFYNLLEECENISSIELKNESYSIQENPYLLTNLRSAVSDTKLNELIKVSSYLNIVLSIYLSEYRIKIFQPKTDSLLFSTQSKLLANSLSNFVLKLDSLRVLKNYFEQFFLDLILYYQKFACNVETNPLKIRIYMHSLEKFHFICASTYDSMLTIPFLQYYWKNVEKSMEKIALLFPDCWSNTLNMYSKQLHDDFFFNDRLYNAYFSCWNLVRDELMNKKIYIKNENASVLCRRINAELVRFSGIEKERTLQGFIEKLHFYENFEKIQACIKDYTSRDNSIEKCLQSINDLNLAIGCGEELVLTAFAKYRMQPIDNLYNLMSMNKKISTQDTLEVFNCLAPANYTELSFKYLKLGKLYSIFKLSLNRCSFSYLKYDELLSTFNFLNKTDAAQIEEENWSIQKKSQINCLHYNWLHSYLFKLLNTDEQNDKTGTKLKYYNDEMLQLDNLILFMWSKCSLVSDGYASSEINDLHLVKLVGEELTQICDKLFQSDDNLFYNYLFEKGFDKAFLKYLNPQASNISDIAKTLIIYGCILVYTFSPIRPLDPLMHNNMIIVDENEIKSIILNEHNTHLELAEKKCGKAINNSFYYSMHKDYLQENNTNTLNIVDNMGYRDNNSEYFNIVNEFSNACEQFCSIKQIVKIFQIFDKLDKKSCNEYETWRLSLENFIEKCMKNFYLCNDIINRPLVGFCLIGNSFFIYNLDKN